MTSEPFIAALKYQFLWWFGIGLVALSTLLIPFLIATDNTPNLDLLLTSYSIAGFFWIGLLYESGKRTTAVTLHPEGFAVKKAGRSARHFLYSAIQSHNERPNYNRQGSFSELTIYLPGYWFAVRSNEFTDYEYLKSVLTQYGQAMIYRPALTLPERNWLRVAIVALVGLILANMAFGYLAHDEANPNPARLKTLPVVVAEVKAQYVKSRFKGVSICSPDCSGITFYVARRHYEAAIDTLPETIVAGMLIELLIRESDYRKKIAKTQPLTFGDKYTGDFDEVNVFGVRQGSWVRVRSSQPVYEPTHTKPHQRAMLLSFLLLLCWTGWVQIDRYVVLRI
ncbi:hypothetical protein [Spirosoma montaniterrae]|uniref:Uncharacterized protein n=1 Tax=Spirosoma montaniterrae TaxID=1178516 RepID=A0A1P9WVD0_9BACT|nr:hypothetical protein [Spirosoma montaniterrae]AQG79313.1 hypothetical protein AWR27_08250 [Spirosoma montaniterrae]